MSDQRPGDLGWTTLLSGERVRKDHALPALCGEFDELSCHLGLARAQAGLLLDQWGLPREPREALLRLRGELTLMQQDLLAAGAAVSAARWTWQDAGQAISRLEALAEWCRQHSHSAGGFVLPGSCPPEACLHLARAVCRRVERSAFGVLGQGLLPGGEELGTYLNRMSLALYGAARVIDQVCSGMEVVPR